MERMGDILAKNASRRAALPGTKRPGEVLEGIANAASAPSAPGPAQGQAAARVQRSGTTVPLSRRVPARLPRVQEAGSLAAPAVPAEAPRAPREADTLAGGVPALTADALPADRILELPRRGDGRSASAREQRALPTTPTRGAPQGQGAAGATTPAPAMARPRAASSLASRGGPVVRQQRREGGASGALTPLGEAAQVFLAARPAQQAAPRGASEQGQGPRELGGKAPVGPERALGRRTGQGGQDGQEVCPHCGGTGYLYVDVPLGDPSFGHAVPCVCKERQKEERRRSDLRRLSSLDPFIDKTFDSFEQVVPGVREAFESARRYAEQPEGWLMLMGGYGAGKTHLAAAIANERLAAGSPVFFSIVPDLLDHLRSAFAPSSEVTYDEMFDKVREVELLVLDDLGAENGTAWASEKLFQLINYRYNFRMPTVITTNNRLLSHMDERIRSRLSDLSLVRHLVMEAQDYRERRAGRAPRAGGPPRGTRGGSGFSR